MARDLYTAGRSMPVIASELGLKPWTVRAYTDGLPRKVGRGHAVPPSVREAIVWMASTGARQRDIACQYGVSQPVVSRILAAERRNEAVAA